MTDNIALIMVDEAMLESEDMIVPFLATGFTKLSGIVATGDVKQFGPLVTSSRKQNPLNSYTASSLPTRLVRLGHPVTWLVQQIRMVT